MITSRKINILIISLLSIAVVFTGILVFIPRMTDNEVSASQPDYAEQIFNKNKITTINIQIDEAEWQNMLDNATNEEYTSCDVTINGRTINSVGIRPKGNSSLRTVAGSDSDRYSFKFEFDHYIEGQTFLGLDKMVINNVQSDATYMKDYLSYDLMTYMEVKTPLFAYAKVTVNGKSWGLYIAVEAIEQSFAQRNYGNDFGKFYKPESMGMGDGGALNRTAGQRPPLAARQNNTGKNAVENQPQESKRQQSTQGENLPQHNAQQGDMGKGVFGNSGGGTDLVYTDDKIDSYSSIFDNEVFKGSKSDHNKVIKALKNLNSGTDIEKYIDVDATLRYLAASTVVVNMDSYFGNMKHNYYLYEAGGKLTMLPWDYNLAFGGFQMGSAREAVNLAVDTPVSGVEMSERPMLTKLLEVKEYKEKYHKYLKQIVDEYFNSGRFERTVNSVNALISNDVNSDATAFYTHEQYTSAVAAIKEFGKLRAQSIQGQLDGTIPSTTAAQSQAGDKLIDASSVNLSTMGSQEGGGGEGRGGMNRQGRGVNPGNQNTQLPERVQQPDGMQQDRDTPEDGKRGIGGLGMEIRAGQQSTGSLYGSGLKLLIFGGSIVILFVGLLFAMKFSRSKYVFINRS